MKFFKILIVFLLIGSKSLFAQADKNTRSTQEANPKILPITVTIGGNFIITGTFTAFPTQRIDHFITQVFVEAKKEALGLTNEIIYSKRILEELDEYSLRNIHLLRADGSERYIDLEKFRITGDFSNNPYLKYDDVIIFPAIDLNRDFIVVEGAISNPCTFQFVEGDKLSDAILFGMGISKAYENVEYAEITRLSYNGLNEQIIKVKIKDDFELLRGDRIRILAKETNKKDFRVTVLGQVNMPGEVFITKNTTTLRQLIKKTGGLTSDAWPERIELYRGDAAKLLLNNNNLTEFDIKDIERRLHISNFEMGRMANLTIEDTLNFQIDNELRFYNEVGNLDFSNLHDSNSVAGSFIVKDGDLVIIPEFENRINVFGQVPRAGKYNFIKGYGYSYYIDQAGGYGEFAEVDEVILIKGRSKNWIPISENEKAEIEPGDFIWVPKEKQRTLEYYLRQASLVAGILGPIATIIVILVTNSGK